MNTEFKVGDIVREESTGFIGVVTLVDPLDIYGNIQYKVFFGGVDGYYDPWYLTLIERN